MSGYINKLRQLLNDPRNQKGNALMFIKNTVPPGEFSSAINLSPLLIREKLAGDNFKSIDEIFQREPFNYTGDFKRELFWLQYNIKHNIKTINQFLLDKNAFEKDFLLARYDDAENCLNEIVRIFGVNLWTIEMTLLLKEYQNDTKENWTTLSDYLGKIKSPFYQFIINFYSKRVEVGMSFENCITQFENELSGVEAETSVHDFFVFKSLLIANYEYSSEDLRSVLYITHLFSAIDQYLVLIEVFMKLLSNNTESDKMILQFIKRNFLSVTNDARISNIINVLEEGSDLIKLCNTDRILPIIDNYTLGNHQKCIDDCNEALVDYPTSFELYEIYCKSLISIGREFRPTNISNLVDDILFNVYESLLYNKSSETNRGKLLKYALTFMSFNLGKQLAAFATNLINDKYKNYHSLLSNLSSTINNPRILTLDLRGREKFVFSKFSKLNNSAACYVNQFITNYEKTLSHFQLLNAIQANIYTARNLFVQSRYNEVIELLEAYTDKNIPSYLYNDVLSLLFASFINTKQLGKAIILSASVITGRTYYSNAFDLVQLCELVKAERLEQFCNLIELPILFNEVYKDYDSYEAYIEFMLANDEEFPSKLRVPELVARFSKEKLIYFLSKVCVIDTIKYSLEFNSIDKAEQERHDILLLLITLDSDNANVYNEEITEILKVSSVRKAIKEVDEGRIYVNIESLKSSQLSKMQETFNRFKEIELTSKEKGLVGFNASKERNWINPEISLQDVNSNLNNPAYLAFKSIYLETREKFLYSKEYGLDSSLSTRIRHGALKNHIRSVFEKLCLVTSKANDVYLDNPKWAEQLAYDPELNEKLQIRLKEFSKQIDDYATYIVENLIQIQTERHTEKREGLFIYYSDDDQLFAFFDENKERFNSVYSIIDILYTDLTNYTNRTICLNVYNTFRKEIIEQYHHFIDTLHTDLRSYGIGNQCDLLPNVLKCSTDIQTELEFISEWFVLNTTSSSSLLDIETIINASIELTNKINPNFHLAPTIEIKCEPFLGFSDLIFVFNILLNNIIEHSKLGPSEVNVCITIDKEDKYVVTHFKNNISQNVDIGKNRKKLESIKTNWNNHSDIERSNKEGESGYDKIKRILLYEAMAKADKFDYFITETDVTISLYFPFNKTVKNEENINH